jgi:hypothetical protein
VHGRQPRADGFDHAEAAVQAVQAGAGRQRLVGEHVTGQVGHDEIARRQEPPRRLDHTRLVIDEPRDLGRAARGVEHDSGSGAEVVRVAEVQDPGSTALVGPQDARSQCPEVVVERRTSRGGEATAPTAGTPRAPGPELPAPMTDRHQSCGSCSAQPARGCTVAIIRRRDEFIVVPEGHGRARSEIEREDRPSRANGSLAMAEVLGHQLRSPNRGSGARSRT